MSDMNGADRAYAEAMEAIEGYCVLCEVSGHTVRTCPARDDEDLFSEGDELAHLREQDG